MTLVHSPYLGWKIGFTLLTVTTIYCGQRISNVGARHAVLLSLIALSCFVEAHISTWHWWRPFAEPAARYTTPGSATRFLQQFPPEFNRVYTRVNRFVEELTLTPRLDPANVTALYSLHNVAGAEPLILDRYSRALGRVLDDAVTPRFGAQPNLALFGSRSHVLDLLNTRFVVAYAGLVTAPDFLINKDNVKYTRNLNIELPPGSSITLAGVGGSGDALAIVSTLSRASSVAQDLEVARLRIFTTAGQTLERSLRAGVDTAEWAHDRPDVQPSIAHQLAQIFEDYPGDATGSFKAHLYVTRLDLGATTEISQVEIRNVAPNAVLNLTAVSLVDSAQRGSTPLAALDARRWQVVYNHDDVLILSNNQPLPRAWLVSKAEAVDGEEALRRITGESEHAFDPRQTALLEVSQAELPALPGGTLASESKANIIQYKPTQLVIETSAPTETVLVLSEIFYPGWEATIDDHPAPIRITDFVLRGVALPAGQHKVEMRYVAPAARNGLLLGVGTVVLLSLGLYWDRFRRANQL
jgi:hypothetical protein